MRTSDVFVLPSIEEGSALASAEAIASGCVPLVSDATSGVCTDNLNSLVHPVGDVATLTRHITTLYESPDTLARLRNGCMNTGPQITWTQCGVRLLEVYRQVVDEFQNEFRPAAASVA